MLVKRDDLSPIGRSGSCFTGFVGALWIERGNSIPTGFPNGLRAKFAASAKLGRCEHLDD
jgi:hypothetical protein